MNDIAELERRITSAMERITRAVENLALPEAGADPEELGALKEALEVERTANAQLEERVKAIKVKQDTNVDQLEQRIIRLREKLQSLESDAMRLKMVNAQLRENNSALRAANEAGNPEPHLINKSMMAELEALRATRKVETGELDAILDELNPLVGGDV